MCASLGVANLGNWLQLLSGVVPSEGAVEVFVINDTDLLIQCLIWRIWLNTVVLGLVFFDGVGWHQDSTAGAPLIDDLISVMFWWQNNCPQFVKVGEEGLTGSKPVKSERFWGWDGDLWKSTAFEWRCGSVEGVEGGRSSQSLSYCTPREIPRSGGGSEEEDERDEWANDGLCLARLRVWWF